MPIQGEVIDLARSAVGPRQFVVGDRPALETET